MRRPLTVTLIVGTIGVLGFWVSEFFERCGPTLVPSLRRPDEEAASTLCRRAAFLPVLNETLDAVGSGDLSLSDASRLLMEDAARLHPAFLRYIEVSEATGPLDVKFAHYLLGYFAGDPAWRYDTIDNARRELLVQEYQRLSTRCGGL